MPASVGAINNDIPYFFMSKLILNVLLSYKNVIFPVFITNKLLYDEAENTKKTN